MEHRDIEGVPYWCNAQVGFRIYPVHTDNDSDMAIAVDVFIWMVRRDIASKQTQKDSPHVLTLFRHGALRNSTQTSTSTHKSSTTATRP